MGCGPPFLFRLILGCRRLDCLPNWLCRLSSGFFEFADRLAKSSAKLGQLPGPEEDQCDRQDYDEVNGLETKQHIRLLWGFSLANADKGRMDSTPTYQYKLYSPVQVREKGTENDPKGTMKDAG